VLQQIDWVFSLTNVLTYNYMVHVPWFVELTDVRDGKAGTLAKLLRLGVTIPASIVVPHDVFAAVVQPPLRPSLYASLDDWSSYWSDVAHRIEHAILPTEMALSLQQHVARWETSSLAVRSSMAIEDQVNGAAPGVFESKLHIHPDNILDAIRAVWLSACTPMLGRYRAHFGQRNETFAIDVLIQRFVNGTKIVGYSRHPEFSKRDVMLVQRDHQTLEIPRDASDELVRLLLTIENVIPAPNGVDVELIESVDGNFTVVQARPIVTSTAPATSITPVPAALLTPLISDGRRWTLDVAHNPSPLSIAQCELVRAVNAAGVAPYSMELLAGFLYSASKPEHVFGIDVAVTDADQVAAHWSKLAQEVEPSIQRRAESLASALEKYLDFYQLWANHVTPFIAAARRVLSDAFVEYNIDDETQLTIATSLQRASAVDRQLMLCAHGTLSLDELHQQIADVSTQWDVSAATYAEQWPSVEAAIDRLRATFRTNHMPKLVEVVDDRLGNAIAVARLAADYAEQDDRWFFQAQANIRRALLQRASELAVEPNDIFWLPWSMIMDASEVNPTEVRSKAGAARASAKRAAQWHMPLLVGGTSSHRQAQTAMGGGSICSGVVRRIRHDSEISAIGAMASTIVVARALTPGMAIQLVGATAVVCDSGGYLDHGAAMARELGISYVVGVGDLFDRCRDGQRIAVDPVAGIVSLGD
jgi:phosphohistidine swiveling domain-containing protein